MTLASPVPSTSLSPATLVQSAILAPSPDNNQPWRFAWEKDQLSVFLDPGRALPSDVHSMFDLIGLGATIENACIRARQLGYEPQVRYVPLAPGGNGGETPRLISTICFVPGAQPDPLFAHLASRTTCRRLYSTRPPAEDALARLTEAANGFSEVQLDWVADRRRIRALARLIAASDRIRFEYEPFHNELVRQLRFSPAEAERTRDGLDLRTLELPPGASLLLRFLRPWSRMRWVHRLRLGGLLSFPSALAVRHSGAIGVLSVRGPASDQFLEGGRALQRVWLTTQAEGLSFQPLGSLPIFFAHAKLLEGRRLSPRHFSLVQKLIGRFTAISPSTRDRLLLLLFRIGNSAAPRFHSLRRPADDVFPPLDTSRNSCGPQCNE